MLRRQSQLADRSTVAGCRNNVGTADQLGAVYGLAHTNAFGLTLAQVRSFIPLLLRIPYEMRIHKFTDNAIW